jgi:hypothetical protein
MKLNNRYGKNAVRVKKPKDVSKLDVRICDFKNESV